MPKGELITKRPATIASVRGTVEALATVGEMQASLRQAIFDAVSENDITEIVKKQVAKAKSGDERAANFVMKFAAGAGAPVTIKQTVVMVTDVATAARLAKQ